MSKLVWDQVGERLFETGAFSAVLYPVSAEGTYPKGVAWNGFTGFEESPSGGEASKIYADNSVYGVLYSAEEFGGTIKAYMYPDEFAVCDGSADIAEGVTIGQQARKPFGFVYKSNIGCDVDNNDHGYKIHCIYNCRVSPSSKSYATINDSPEAMELSWEVTTTPVTLENGKTTATLVIDSTKLDKAKLAKVEAALFGSESAEAYLPLPDKLLELIAE